MTWTSSLPIVAEYCCSTVGWRLLASLVRDCADATLHRYQLMLKCCVQLYQAIDGAPGLIAKQHRVFAKGRRLSAGGADGSRRSGHATTSVRRRKPQNFSDI